MSASLVWVTALRWRTARRPLYLTRERPTSSDTRKRRRTDRNGQQSLCPFLPPL